MAQSVLAQGGHAPESGEIIRFLMKLKDGMPAYLAHTQREKMPARLTVRDPRRLRSGRNGRRAELDFHS